MRLIIVLLFISVILRPQNGAGAADKSCQYSDTTFDVVSYDKQCSPQNSHAADCSFQISYTIASDCMKALEVFYVCQAAIEYSTDDFFTKPAKVHTDKIGSVVIHDGKGEGVVKMHWQPVNPVVNVKITQANCHVTDTYPLDAQK